jgi:hypothetical protein
MKILVRHFCNSVTWKVGKEDELGESWARIMFRGGLLE